MHKVFFRDSQSFLIRVHLYVQKILGGAYRCALQKHYPSDSHLLEKERKMKRRIVALFIVAVLSILTAVPVSANRGDGALGVVYVSSQGKYYDTFVSAKSLPMKGPFQLLDAENGVTSYGPGDQGYVGGRWWIDSNGDGDMNEGDTFLLCPLLGPGRDSP
jgi:hypothetical protein